MPMISLSVPADGIIGEIHGHSKCVLGVKTRTMPLRNADTIQSDRPSMIHGVIQMLFFGGILLHDLDSGVVITTKGDTSHATFASSEGTTHLCPYASVRLLFLFATVLVLPLFLPTHLCPLIDPILNLT